MTLNFFSYYSIMSLFPECQKWHFFMSGSFRNTDLATIELYRRIKSPFMRLIQGFSQSSNVYLPFADFTWIMD